MPSSRCQQDKVNKIFVYLRCRSYSSCDVCHDPILFSPPRRFIIIPCLPGSPSAPPISLVIQVGISASALATVQRYPAGRLPKLTQIQAEIRLLRLCGHGQGHGCYLSLHIQGQITRRVRSRLEPSEIEHQTLARDGEKWRRKQFLKHVSWILTINGPAYDAEQGIDQSRSVKQECISREKTYQPRKIDSTGHLGHLMKTIEHEDQYKAIENEGYGQDRPLTDIHHWRNFRHIRKNLRVWGVLA